MIGLNFVCSQNLTQALTEIDNHLNSIGRNTINLTRQMQTPPYDRTYSGLTECDNHLNNLPPPMISKNSLWQFIKPIILFGISEVM